LTTTLYFRNQKEFNRHMKHQFLWDNPKTRYVVMNGRKAFRKKKVKYFE
jgi:hypothetical protein